MKACHSLHRRWPIAVLGSFVGCTALGAEWTTIPESSSVTLYATKQGAWFNGTFADFSAVIEFDESAPETGHIAGTVRTSTIDTGDDQNDEYVRAYLDVGQFPEAHFVSQSIEHIPEGFRANGELTLKGTTRPVSLDFAFSASGNVAGAPATARFSGRMTIDRFEFDIASDIDTNWTGQEVTVIIELSLER